MRGGATSIGWLCTRCTSTNLPDSDRCCNPRCQLAKKVAGVELKSEGGSSRAGTVRPPLPEATFYGLEKRKRCGECEGCLAKNCTRCEMCLDMPKYGGKGTKRQTCLMRQCAMLVAENEEREAEKASLVALQREKRVMEREAQLKARAERREQDRLEKLEMSRLKQETREAKEATKEARRLAKLEERAARQAGGRGRRAHGARWDEEGRLASIRLPELPREDSAYGWGLLATYPPGTAVEVRDLAEGLHGAFFAAQIVEPTEVDLQKRLLQEPSTEAADVAMASASATGGTNLTAGVETAAPLADPTAACSASGQLDADGGHLPASAPSGNELSIFLEYCDLLETDDDDSCASRARLPAQRQISRRFHARLHGLAPPRASDCGRPPVTAVLRFASG